MRILSIGKQFQSSSHLIPIFNTRTGDCFFYNPTRGSLERKCQNYSIPVNPLENQKYYFERFESAYYLELPKGKAIN